MTTYFVHLRTFQAVAVHRGFTAAGRALGIGQPTVTTQIRELEERFQVELLQRRGRKIELTEAGQSLFEITQRMMSLYGEAEELLANQGRFRYGELSLASIGAFHATRMLGTFKRSYPEVSMTIHLGTGQETLSRLLDMTADVAILAQEVSDPAVVTCQYCSHPLLVSVHRSHEWFERESIALAELADQPLVLRESGSTSRRILEEALEEAGIATRSVLEITSPDGVRKAVENGLGIGVLPDFETAAHPDVRALRIEEESLCMDFRIAYLRDRKNSPKIKAFLRVFSKQHPHAGKSQEAV